MYNPRYGLGYVTQPRVNAQLGVLHADTQERSAASDEAGALWRMLTVLGVMAVVAFGMVLAMVAAGALQ